MKAVGTIKNAAGGVTWSRGRGAAKVTLFIDYKSIGRWAKKTRQDNELLWRKAKAAACKGLKDKFRRVVENAGGVEGVPKFKDFDDFTLALREKRRITRPMGGVLADKQHIGAEKRNGIQYIGWKDYLKDVAIRFQEGGDAKDDAKFTDPGSRRLWHMEGFKTIPDAYAHNPRRVLPEPFGSYVKQYLVEWARGAYFKALARLMIKNGGVAA